MTNTEIKALIQKKRIEIGERLLNKNELNDLIKFLDYIWKDEDFTDQEKMDIIHEASMNMKGIR